MNTFGLEKKRECSHNFNFEMYNSIISLAFKADMGILVRKSSFSTNCVLTKHPNLQFGSSNNQLYDFSFFQMCVDANWKT